MDFKEISRDFRLVGKSLFDRTKYSGRLGKGMRDMHDLAPDINKRVDKILLRVGVEFLLKAVYLKDGYNIYRLNNGVKGKNEFDTIQNIGESNLNLESTISFKNLIENMSGLPSVTVKLVSEIKAVLEDIRKAGNPAVHSHKLNEIKPERANLVNGRLLSVLDA